MALSANLNGNTLPAGSPAIGGAGQYVKGPGDAQEPAIVGYFTVSGDSAATQATLNWIDGTVALPFTPTAVLATRSGGTAAATVYVQSVTAIGTQSCTVTISGTLGGTTQTLGVICQIFK